MIVLTGGGTGGHLSCVCTIKDALNASGVFPVFIGSLHGMDQDWMGKHQGFAAQYFLNATAVMNRSFLSKSASFARMGAAALIAGKLLAQHQIKAVLSMGAYSAAPASFAAIFKRIPLFIHEHNARMGRLHQLLKPCAKAVFSSYDAGSPLRDYPVAPTFFKNQRKRTRVKRVLFLGGSQGSHFLNHLALQWAPDLRRLGIEISHQTGEKEFIEIKNSYEKLNLEVDVFPFSWELGSKMAVSDFAVSRAGAGTTWELVANGLPTLFIPYPHAVGNHQFFNADYLRKKGLAFVASEEEVDWDTLNRCLESDLETISSRLPELIQPHGAGSIARFLLNQIE